MNWSTEYYRSKLSQGEKEAYDIIWLGWGRADKQVAIPESLISAEGIPRAYNAIDKDHPELFWVNPHEYRMAVRSAGLGPHLIEMSLFHKPETISKLSSIIDEWREKVLSKLGGSTDKDETFWQLCDLIAHEVDFGEDGLASSHTIVGATAHGGCQMVCEGISKTLKYICDLIGIPCICVTGRLEVGDGRYQAHMWNIVEFSGGRRRHIDLTALISTINREDGRCGELERIHPRRDEEMTGYGWAQDEVPRCT